MGDSKKASHQRRFHGMDDAKEIWAAIKTRFGGNANSKKMQKAVLKQQFEAFTISSKESLEKGYDRFQKLLSQLDALGAGVSDEDANHKFLRSLPPAWDSLAMTMRTKKNIDTLSIDDLYNNLSVFEQDIQKTSSSSLASDNVAFLSQAKASSSKHKPSHSSGSYSSYTTSSSKATPTATPGLADEVIHSFLATNADDVDLIHEDLDQIDDLDLEEMDINWQIAMTAIKIKKFYKKTGRRPRVDGKMHVAFDKRKVECFNCHNTGHFARECKFKGSKEGSRQEAGRGQDFKPVRTEKEALMTIDEGQINWVEQTTDEELNHALMAFTVNNEVSMCSKLCLDSYNALQAKYDELQSEFGDQEAALVAHKLAVKKLESQLKASHKQQSSLTEKLNFQANQIFEKDEKLKKYRRIGMKAVKDKDALQQIFDSWSASSKNLWKLIDCGMSSTVKIGLGYGIKSNAEVLGYEEEISRGIFAFRETDAGNYDIPLYSRFKQVEYKGVPHPLSGDYTPREQEDIDDSLYEYGKYGPQPQSPSPTESDASSTVYSTCQSNDSDGEQGTVSDHSVNDDPIPIPSIEQVTIATQKTQPQVPKPQQTVDPSCAQHVKTPRQPIRTPVTPSPIPSYNRQNWNQGMQRDLGTGYSFERKPCFVCGSLSHLIKDCDYYEKKMAREAAFKSTRVVHANVRQATPAWTNSNRVNKANQFTPRPVQLNNIRPNLSTASKTIKTGRVNVNTGHGNVSSVSSAGTQIKSGASRFNTGKQHVNSGSVHVNTARVNRPVSNQTLNKTSPKLSHVNLTILKKCFSKQRSPVNRPFSRNIAHKLNKYAVKGRMGTAVKTSDHPLKHMEHRGIFDSGCSGHMTGNRAHLKDYQELSKVGSVTFGGSKGSINGKGTIRLGNLVFDDVAFVKELGHFNLFSISQICDKKLNVLFTEKECFVVSSDFKMPDENQVLLKVPRQHNMYTFDMKNVVSSQEYTCLLAKASSNEAKLWHRRLGHINFKNLNKLVKDNLVRGLPSKSFKNDHTCVACQKGKQHKASCKAKIDRYVTHPLHILHMDLFGPTSVRSINHASYCLVITDDCSRLLNLYILFSVQNQANPAVQRELLQKKTHSPRQPIFYTISKSADDIMTFRKELDALALKHLGPVPTTVPTSTNPVNTGSINLNTAFEEVKPQYEAISPIRYLMKRLLYDEDYLTDFNNLPDEVDVPTNPTLRIHNAHPQSQILGDPNTPESHRILEEEAGLEAMQKKLLQFKLSTIWSTSQAEQGRHLHISRLSMYLRYPRNLILCMSKLPPSHGDQVAFDKDEEAFYALWFVHGFSGNSKDFSSQAVKNLQYLKGKPNLGIRYPRESPLIWNQSLIVTMVVPNLYEGNPQQWLSISLVKDISPAMQETTDCTTSTTEAE
ncbi:ribonuclease H-like domain-containing protein [Tanacetum coccineum]|uniref:Ribonuclease H-like domain-containing protein n=1 Tax=Tanacetum coccineum TaxID=301880 RepID=A0ABQ4WFN9_9ASTR